MSYSRRQLYAMGEPLGDGATRREVGGKVIYGGGGGGGTPEKQTQIVDLPEWAKPYAKESLGKASALSASPYQAYGGERFAQFNPLQKQAFDAAAQQKVADQIGTGSSLAGTAGLAGLAGGYKAGQFGSQMGQYMSPYMDAVVQRQMDSAQRQADIAGTQRGAQAVRAGAFGGSRQAIEDAEAARALASQKGEIQAQGLQSAYDRATDMYSREQALAEQSRQAGLSTALQGAQTLGQLGTQQFGQQMDITSKQQELGGIQRQATQDILGAQYQDFLNQQRAPYDQLAFMTSMIRGTPMGQTTTMYQPAPSTTSQLIGLGTAAAGAYGAYKGAAGGEIPSYATGGIASLSQPEIAATADGMSDQQLQQTQGLPSITELARMTLAAEAQQRAQMRQAAAAQQAMMQQQPEGTVAEEQMAALGGIGDLPAPNLENMGEGMAGGGIIAFQNRGEVPNPEDPLERQRAEDREKIQRAYQSGLISAEEFGRAIADIGMLPVRGIAGAVDTAVVRPLRAAGADVGYLSPYLVPEGADPESMTPFYDQMRSPAPAAAPAPGIAALADGSDNRFRRGPAVAGITDQPPAKVAAETADVDRMPAPPGVGGLGGIMGMMDKEQARRIAVQADIDKQRAADVATARGELSEEEKMAREFGSERETRLKKQEEGFDKSEKNNLNMTLIEVGLAMMAGESPNALKNIAAGAQQGLKGFETRLSKIQSGREKVDESMARLAEIRQEKLSAVGAEKRRLNALERQTLTESKAAQESIASAFADKKITLTADQAKQANARAFDMYRYKMERADSAKKESRLDQRTQASAAQDLLRSAQKVMLESTDTAEVEQAKKDFAAASGVLRSVAGASSGALSQSDQALINKYR